MSDTLSLTADLRANVDGEVRFDPGSLGAYSTDASNFRQVPLGVVVPHTVSAAVEAIDVCRRHDVPVLSRGGGTSLAGQCTNSGVVLDWSKYCNGLISLDADQKRCVVEPGIVLDELNRELASSGLRFGPEPATHYNCTLGGMIGNNSCGATAQRTGKVVDNIVSLEVLLYDGTRFWCGPTSSEEYEEIVAPNDRRAEIYRHLASIRDEYGARIRAGYPNIPRRVSGYNLDSLLTENNFDVAKALVGSESTLVTILHAELKLVPVVKERTLVVLGYPGIVSAGKAASHVASYDPIALEAVDKRLVTDEQIKHLHRTALEDLPDGEAWLMAQFGGETKQEASQAAQKLVQSSEVTANTTVQVAEDPTVEDDLWKVRESGLGATAHVPGHRETWEGWEDSAVPPEKLGEYLGDFEKLCEEFGYADETAPSLYGHFGQGCVHTRIPFDLFDHQGVATYRRFLERAADLVASYGGSLSGEHGDGQTRGELLERMFGRELVSAFEAVKDVFDPQDRMNPGKVVRPARADDNLRLGATWTPAHLGPLRLDLPNDGGSFAHAANRCVGVGKCRQLTTEGGAVMCPSYQVTREEKHSTRGRSRLLFEMLDGHRDSPVQGRWRSDAVRDALDLCLSCKGCKSDCPVSVDMAAYKAEFLYHHWRRRLRPRSHYSLGWLPVMAAAVSTARAGRAFNLLTRHEAGRKLATSLAGVEDRPLPQFGQPSLQRWAAKRRPPRGKRGDVVLWPDTFTNHFSPDIGRSAVELMESAGWQVHVPTEAMCCGLTWHSTGQLDMARRVLRRSIDRVIRHVENGALVVGLEPSCTAVLRSDGQDLLPGDVAARRVADRTVTLAELLTEHTPDWRPPQSPTGRHKALVQVHCHQHADLGWDADRRLLEAAGVEGEQMESGCCGLAGNFGFEPGHFDVSQACAERVMLPTIRAADADTTILADGFSCRTQVHQLDSGGRDAIHTAQLLRSFM